MAAKLAGVDLILLGSQRLITNVALRLVRISLFCRALKLKNCLLNLKVNLFASNKDLEIVFHQVLSEIQSMPLLIVGNREELAATLHAVDRLSGR